MIKLKSTDTLQILLGAAVATNQCDLTASFSDVAADSSSAAPNSSDGTSNGTTAVSWVSSPASGFVRQISYLSFYNADTAAVTVTVRKNNGTNTRIYFKATLAPGDRIEYTVDGGFRTVLNGSVSSVINVQIVASAATVTPTFANDLVRVTAQAAALTIANPTGTAIDGWGFAFEIKDNGTSRAITWGTQYRGIGGVLPTTTVAGKNMIFGAIYNSADGKMDVILPVAQEA